MAVDPNKRYFFDQDNDSHWYLVEEAYRGDWDRWSELDSDDPEAWEAPGYAISLGCHPNQYSFTKVKER